MFATCSQSKLACCSSMQSIGLRATVAGDLKRRGLDVPPRLVIADGALGLWKAAGEVWPKRASSAAGCTRPRTPASPDLFDPVAFGRSNCQSRLTDSEDSPFS